MPHVEFTMTEMRRIIEERDRYKAALEQIIESEKRAAGENTVWHPVIIARGALGRL